MLRLRAAVLQAVFNPNLREAINIARGFEGTDVAKARIENIVRAFVHGYNAALSSTELEEVALSLTFVDIDLQGFAFEGVGMGLTTLDQIDPRQGYRCRNFLDGPGHYHIPLVHLGEGFAFARLPRGHARLQRFLARCDDQLKWWVVDGYGFHHGFFNRTRTVDRQERPQFRIAYASRAFDQGLGRGLWFVECADVDRVVKRVRTFEPARQADLLNGVGIAATYSGGVDEEGLARLAANVGRDLADLQLGVALAAMVRWQSGNASAHTASASKVICARSDTELAQRGIELQEEALDAWRKNIPPDPYPNYYERWRSQLRSAIQ